MIKYFTNRLLRHKDNDVWLHLICRKQHKILHGSDQQQSIPSLIWVLFIGAGSFLLYYFKTTSNQQKNYIHQKKDISNIDDIKKLVDAFYLKVRNDNLIGPVFKNYVGDDWLSHLDKMYRFWQTVLLGELTYFGSPFPPHKNMDIDHKHFQRWLDLFIPTVDELFEGAKATEIKWRAEKIVELFKSKLALYKKK